MTRFYIRESTGYLIGPAGKTGGNAAHVTEVLVLDRDYCHRVVWSSLPRGRHQYVLRFPALRAEAQRLCDEWNAEDRADARVAA